MKSSKQQILILLNPTAGSSHTGQTVKKIKDLFDRAGASATVHVTASQEDAYERSVHVDDRYDRVVAAGGDGTVHTVISGMLDGGVTLPLGILPIGTGNLLAADLGIPRHLPRAVTTVLEGGTREIDVGYFPERQKYLTVSAATGFGARIIFDASRDLKRWLGIGGYFVSAVRNVFRLRRYRVTIVADGKVYRKKSDLVFITNVNFVWPWKFSTREGLQVDDGKLDIFIMREASLAGWLSILVFMVFSRAGKDPRITHIQAKRIALHSYPDAPMQIDGEANGTTPFSVEVIPKAIPVLVPKM